MLLVNAGIIVSIRSIRLKSLVIGDGHSGQGRYPLPTMSDEESYATDGKGMFDGSLKKKGEKALSTKDLEPFGNEETAEVKYRTMKWW